MHCFTASLTNKQAICQILVDRNLDTSSLEDRRAQQLLMEQLARMLLSGAGGGGGTGAGGGSLQSFGKNSFGNLGENSRLFEKHIYRALIDTGATITCVSSKVVENLQLEIEGEGKVSGVGGQQIHKVYSACIFFPIPPSSSRPSDSTDPNKAHQLKNSDDQKFDNQKKSDFEKSASLNSGDSGGSGSSASSGGAGSSEPLGYHLSRYSNLRVTQLHTTSKNFDVIIGMDIIEAGRLEIFQGNYTFCV